MVLTDLDLKGSQHAHLSGSVSQKFSFVPASSAERPCETGTRIATFRPGDDCQLKKLLIWIFEIFLLRSRPRPWESLPS